MTPPTATADADAPAIEAYFRRQMTAIGTTAMEQLGLLRVLVVGLRGVGVEVAKCLAFSGVQRLTLMDDERVRTDDVESNFLLRPEDVGKGKSNVVATRLDERCPFCDVRAISGALTLDLILNFHAVVFCSPTMSHHDLIAFNEFCRNQCPPIAFILAESWGLFGLVFSDFSAAHTSKETLPGMSDVELCIQTKKTRIEKDSAEIFLRCPFNIAQIFRAGDLVSVRCSPNPARDGVAYVVDHVFDSSVRIRLECEYQAPLRAELQQANRLRRIPCTTKTSHRSLRECFVAPGTLSTPLNPRCSPDFQNNLHMAMIGIHAIQHEYGVLPSTIDANHIQHILELIREHILMTRDLQSPPAAAEALDEGIIRRLLRCAGIDLQPHSAVVGGYAALQVFKFTGAFGPPHGQPGQFIYFDILDCSPSELMEPEATVLMHHQSRPLQSVFGARLSEQLANTTFVIFGVGATNSEVLKNCLSLGIGSCSKQVMVERDCSTRIMQASELAAHAMQHPNVVNSSFFDAWTNTCGTQLNVVADQASVDWSTVGVISCESFDHASLIELDGHCRQYEIPLVVTNHTRSSVSRLEIAHPLTTATPAERLVPREIASDPSVFLFDHIPYHFTSRLKPSCNVTESEGVVAWARQTFERIFTTAVDIANKYFSGASVSDDVDNDSIWLVWTVAQRAVAAKDFEACLKVAWTIVELIPLLWMGSRDTTTNTEVDGAHQTIPTLLVIDTQDIDHLQLLVATAAIIALSSQTRIPSLDERRVAVDRAAADQTKFSLHHNLRSRSTIEQGFASANHDELVRLTDKVEAISFDVDDPVSWYLHFLQGLANIYLESSHAPRILDMPHLLRLLQAPADFIPVSTITGGLVTLKMLDVVTLKNSPRLPPSIEEYTINSLDARISAHKAPLPLLVRSMPFEATRGAGIRTVPDEFSRWTKLNLPISADLQSPVAVTRYLEAKYSVVIHALRVLPSRQRLALSSRESIFALAPTPIDAARASVLLDVAAVDARDRREVVFAPLWLRPIRS